MRDASAFFRMIEREDRDLVEASIVESGRTLRTWRCEFRLYRRDAAPRWLNGAATPQREPDGSVLWHGYIQDVTDQHELDRAREAAAAAQASNRAKTEFLSRMSHELRTPLNAVLGFAQLLELDAHAPLSETQRRRVELIREAGAHLLQMIGELLDLTRIESGQLAVTLAAAAAGAAAGRLRRVRARAGRCRRRRAALRCRRHTLVGARRCHAAAPGAAEPAGQRHQVQPPRRQRAAACATHGDLVVLLVSDTGVGIASADLPALFEPFNRGAHQHSVIEGAGIGLAVTRALVELMGGRIDVASVPGQGSTFSVTLAAA